MTRKKLLEQNTFTKEQLIEHAVKRNDAIQALIAAPETSQGCRDYYRRELALDEIVLAALAAVPVGYINRYTGVFHKPESMTGDDFDRTLYFPVFGAHPLVAGGAI